MIFAFEGHWNTGYRNVNMLANAYKQTVACTYVHMSMLKKQRKSEGEWTDLDAFLVLMLVAWERSLTFCTHNHSQVEPSHQPTSVPLESS
jgi:hypothetical protein